MNKTLSLEPIPHKIVHFKNTKEETQADSNPIASGSILREEFDKELNRHLKPQNQTAVVIRELDKFSLENEM